MGERNRGYCTLRKEAVEPLIAEWEAAMVWGFWVSCVR